MVEAWQGGDVRRFRGPGTKGREKTIKFADYGVYRQKWKLKNWAKNEENMRVGGEKRRK